MTYTEYKYLYIYIYTYRYVYIYHMTMCMKYDKYNMRFHLPTFGGKPKVLTSGSINGASMATHLSNLGHTSDVCWFIDPCDDVVN